MSQVAGTIIKFIPSASLFYPLLLSILSLIILFIVMFNLNLLQEA